MTSKRPQLGRAEKLIKGAVQMHGKRGPNSRGEYSTCCPWCQIKTGDPDTKFKLQLNVEKGLYNCYRCGSGGHAEVATILEVEIDQAPGEQKPTELEPMPHEARPLDPNALSHRPYTNYLLGRNLYQEALAARVYVCTTGYYAGRIVVPHMLPSMNIYGGFSARTIVKGVEPKYLHAKGMNRRGTVWGANLRWTPHLYVVEGVFDALALYGRAIATFGKNITDEQMTWVEGAHRLGSQIIVCLDGDAWEECAAIAMQLTLRGVKDVRWCRLPPGTDPGTLKDQVAKYIVGKPTTTP